MHVAMLIHSSPWSWGSSNELRDVPSTELEDGPNGPINIDQDPVHVAMEASESDVRMFKILAALLLFTFAIAGGLLPYKLRSISAKVVSCLNTAAGGVFFATAMVHMLPESSETLTEELGDSFPWGGFFCASGFLLILCLAQAVQIIQDRRKNRNNGHTLVPTEPPEAEHHLRGILVDTYQSGGEYMEHLSICPRLRTPLQSNGERRPDGVQHAGLIDSCNGDSPDLEADDSSDHAPINGHDYGGRSITNGSRHRGGDSTDGHRAGHMELNGHGNGGVVGEDHHHGHSHDFVSAGDGVLTRCAVLLALSLHSVMEGLGVGASTGKAYNLLFAIGTHKGLAAYALGTALLKHDMPFYELLVYMGVFSMMSPLGIFIGMLIEEDGESAGGAICVALASGTFLFVGLMEILPPELNSPEFGWTKMFSLLAGFYIAVVVGWVAG